MSSALSCEQRCSDVMYRPMNFEGALQLFNIAASHMKFTKKKFPPANQLKRQHRQTVDVSNARAAITNK